MQFRISASSVENGKVSFCRWNSEDNEWITLLPKCSLHVESAPEYEYAFTVHRMYHISYRSNKDFVFDYYDEKGKTLKFCIVFDSKQDGMEFDRLVRGEIKKTKVLPEALDEIVEYLKMAKQDPASYEYHYLGKMDVAYVLKAFEKVSDEADRLLLYQMVSYMVHLHSEKLLLHMLDGRVLSKIQCLLKVCRKEIKWEQAGKVELVLPKYHSVLESVEKDEGICSMMHNTKKLEYFEMQFLEYGFPLQKDTRNFFYTVKLFNYQTILRYVSKDNPNVILEIVHKMHDSVVEQDFCTMKAMVDFFMEYIGIRNDIDLPMKQTKLLGKENSTKKKSHRVYAQLFCRILTLPSLPEWHWPAKTIFFNMFGSILAQPHGDHLLVSNVLHILNETLHSFEDIDNPKLIRSILVEEQPKQNSTILSSIIHLFHQHDTDTEQILDIISGILQVDETTIEGKLILHGFFRHYWPSLVSPLTNPNTENHKSENQNPQSQVHLLQFITTCLVQHPTTLLFFNLQSTILDFIYASISNPQHSDIILGSIISIGYLRSTIVAGLLLFRAAIAIPKFQFHLNIVKAFSPIFKYIAKNANNLITVRMLNMFTFLHQGQMDSIVLSLFKHFKHEIDSMSNSDIIRNLQQQHKKLTACS